MMVTWRNRWMASAALLSISLLPLQLYAQTDERGMCADAPSENASGNVQVWLERSLQASHCYTFQARAVAINAIDVRTLALSHRIQDGVRQQVVQQLDGPSVSVERRSRVGQLAWSEKSENGAFPSLEGWIDHASQFYDISLDEDVRVAGREAATLRFEPHDQQRYTHEWWLDNATGLLLKHVLSDSTGRILETFQITQLNEPERYTGQVVIDALPVSTEPAWQPSWLPEGFVAQPTFSQDDDAHQRLYSDGLATISIFAEPQAGPQDLNRGVHQIGVSSIAVDEYAEGEQYWQLVGIGEVPPSMLQRIVQSVEFD